MDSLQKIASSKDPADTYELMDCVGTGSYGSVYQCKELKSKKTFAIKILLIDSKEVRPSDVVKEIEMLKDSIECPWIVEYQGAYMKDDVLMLVMEYCTCSVEDILRYVPNYEWKEVEIAAVCAAVIKALVYLHEKNITHRDIKSGNVLLTEDGTAKITDFGISSRLANANDKMKTLIGTPYWLAPEMITSEAYTNKVDLWAAGITAIELAEGQPPHFEMNPQAVIFHIAKQPPPRLKREERWSEEFIQFLSGCLQKEPGARPSAKQLLSDPFILGGSSPQILTPVVKHCFPILGPERKKELDEELETQDEEENPTAMQRGTVLKLDRTTKQAIVDPNQNRNTAIVKE